MFGISFSEIILILLLCLVVFGPKQLPQIASRIGVVILSLQHFWTKTRNEIYHHTGINEIRQTHQDVLHTYHQIKNNIRTNTIISNTTLPSSHTTLHQAELDFNRQPELFDEK